LARIEEGFAMRISIGLAVIGLIALAGCASPPPDNTAAGSAVHADAVAANAAKHCPTGSRVCTKEQQVDPAVASMSGAALGDATRGHTTNGYSGGP
jgi:hypothetical protein